jgi:DNA-binding transcriptional ArsR family regulator
MSDDPHSVRAGDSFGPGAAPSRTPIRHRDGAWIDDVFDVLADEQRRHVLYCLQRTPGSEATVDALLEDVSATLSEGNGRTRDEVVTNLRHVGLPKMSDVGLIEYDARNGVVRFPGEPLVEVLLDVTASRELDGW